MPTWVPIVVSIMGTGLVAKVADILGVTELKAEVTELEKRIDKIEEHEKALMKTLEAIDDRSVETFNLATETYEIVDQAHPAVRDFGTHSPN